MVPSRSGRSKIATNVFALTTLQLVNLLLPLITLPYLLRVLGPEQFGRLALSQALLAYAVVLTEFGFNLSATQKIAHLRGQPVTIANEFWSIQAAKLLLAGVALALITALVVVVPQFREVWPVILATSPVVLGAVLFPQWLFQGLERMGLVTICALCARTVAIPLLFWLINDPGHVWLAALIQSAATVLAGAIAWGIILHDRLIVWSRPSWGDIKRVCGEGWHVFLSTAAISLYTATAPVLLGMLTNPVQVGLFSAADKIRVAVQSMIAPLGTAVFPRVSALMSENRAQGLQLVRVVLLLQGAAALLASLALWFGAPFIVAVLMGDGFAATVPILRLMAALPFIIGLSNVLGIQTMLTLGMKQIFTRIVLVSGIMNIILVLVLAPIWGAPGAASAMLFTELMVAVLMIWALHQSGVHILANRFSARWN